VPSGFKLFASITENPLTLAGRTLMRAAISIPKLQDRYVWINASQAHLYELERVVEPDQESINNWAAWAITDLTAPYLGNYLSSGIQDSYTRKAEMHADFTRALRMRLPVNEPEDFVLELWMGDSYGESILQSSKTMSSVENWEPILGSYLYTAMRTSQWRSMEESTGVLNTRAVSISSPLGNGFDYRFRVMMKFEMGMDVWNTCFFKSS
jgi:hypothetical protein